MDVKFRYEKMMETIAEWENEKKVKARRQKEQKEVSILLIHSLKNTALLIQCFLIQKHSWYKPQTPKRSL